MNQGGAVWRVPTMTAGFWEAKRRVGAATGRGGGAADLPKIAGRVRRELAPIVDAWRGGRAYVQIVQLKTSSPFVGDFHFAHRRAITICAFSAVSSTSEEDRLHYHSLQYAPAQGTSWLPIVGSTDGSHSSCRRFLQATLQPSQTSKHVIAKKERFPVPRA
jgi:hypothetical protein